MHQLCLGLSRCGCSVPFSFSPSVESWAQSLLSRKVRPAWFDPSRAGSLDRLTLLLCSAGCHWLLRAAAQLGCASYHGPPRAHLFNWSTGVTSAPPAGRGNSRNTNNRAVLCVCGHAQVLCTAWAAFSAGTLLAQFPQERQRDKQIMLTYPIFLLFVYLISLSSGV